MKCSKCLHTPEPHVLRSSVPAHHRCRKAFPEPRVLATPHPAFRRHSTLLLHELGNSLDALKSALEAQSVKVCCVRSFQEALLC